MHIRPLTEDDWLALGLLISEAFGRGEPCPDEMSDSQRETFPLSKRLGVFDDGKLVAAATILDIDVAWNGAVQRMGGIGGVCCKAVARGRGHVGSLMREVLPVMRDWGQPISGLYPFSHAFYRRFGWESVVERREYTVPTRIIPAFPEGRNVRTFIGADALDTIKPIYDRYASRYQGMPTRNCKAPDWWDSLLKSWEGLATYVQAYVCPESGGAQGYFTFRFPEAGKPATLGDFVALTPAAYRGLLGTLHNYGTQVESVIWHGPADHPLPLFISERELQTTIQPVMMGRIVDVQAALSLLTSTRDGSAIVRIRDDQADWNDGTFAIVGEDEGDRVTVIRSTAEAQCEMSIQTLSIACWGSYSLLALRAAGRVVVANETAFGFLADILPARLPYISDAF